MTNIQKCGVIGVGFVGATCAYTLAVSGLFSDLVLVDMNRDKAIGEAADINHGVAFSKPCRVMAGDYADLAECGLIIIAAGANQKPGESRLELLGRNKGILSSVIAQLTAVNREAILLVVSNPVDVLTCLAQQLSGFPCRTCTRFRYRAGYRAAQVSARTAAWRGQPQRACVYHRRARRQRAGGMVER